MGTGKDRNLCFWCSSGRNVCCLLATACCNQARPAQINVAKPRLAESMLVCFFSWGDPEKWWSSFWFPFQTTNQWLPRTRHPFGPRLEVMASAPSATGARGSAAARFVCLFVFLVGAKRVVFLWVSGGKKTTKTHTSNRKFEPGKNIFLCASL